MIRVVARPWRNGPSLLSSFLLLSLFIPIFRSLSPFFALIRRLRFFSLFFFFRTTFLTLLFLTFAISLYFLSSLSSTRKRFSYSEFLFPKPTVILSKPSITEMHLNKKDSDGLQLDEMLDNVNVAWYWINDICLVTDAIYEFIAHRYAD